MNEPLYTCLGCGEDLPRSMYGGVKKRINRCSTDANGCYNKYQQDRRDANRTNRKTKPVALNYDDVLIGMLDGRKRLNLDHLTEAQKQQRKDSQNKINNDLRWLPDWMRELRELRRIHRMMKAHECPLHSFWSISRIHRGISQGLEKFSSEWNGPKYASVKSRDADAQGVRTPACTKRMWWLEERIESYLEYPVLIELALERERSRLDTVHNDAKFMLDAFGSDRNIRRFEQEHKEFKLLLRTERRDLLLQRVDTPVIAEELAAEELQGDAESALEARWQMYDDLGVGRNDRRGPAATNASKAEAGMARARNSDRHARERAESKLRAAESEQHSAEFEVMKEIKSIALKLAGEKIAECGIENPTWGQLMPEKYNVETIESEHQKALDLIDNPVVVAGCLDPRVQQAGLYKLNPDHVYTDAEAITKIMLEDGKEAAKAYDDKLLREHVERLTAGRKCAARKRW